MSKSARQQKSRMYYYFWGAMTAIVLLGQLYVGTGYRIMANSNLEFIEFLKSELTRTSNEVYQ
jgi:hypothetical protein